MCASERRNDALSGATESCMASVATHGQDSGRASPDPETDDQQSVPHEEEAVDPRVEEKLEQLNQTTHRINELEKRFEEENASFRSCLRQYSEKLKGLSEQVGVKTVTAAREYYEAMDRAKQAQAECQTSVSGFEKSCRMHQEARDEIDRNEGRFQSIGRHFDPAAQELMNQSALKLKLAEQMKVRSEEQHEKSMQQFLAAEQTAQRLKKQLKHSIIKSQPYFEESEKFREHLDRIKREIEDLNQKISETKRCYSNALKDLEQISEEIHARRNRSLPSSALRSQSPIHQSVHPIQLIAD